MKRQSQLIESNIFELLDRLTPYRPPFQFFAAVLPARDRGLEAAPECVKVSE